MTESVKKVSVVKQSQSGAVRRRHCVDGGAGQFPFGGGGAPQSNIIGGRKEVEKGGESWKKGTKEGRKEENQKRKEQRKEEKMERSKEGRKEGWKDGRKEVRTEERKEGKKEGRKRKRGEGGRVERRVIASK